MLQVLSFGSDCNYKIFTTADLFHDETHSRSICHLIVNLITCSSTLLVSLRSPETNDMLASVTDIVKIVVKVVKIKFKHSFCDNEQMNTDRRYLKWCTASEHNSPFHSIHIMSF